MDAQPLYINLVVPHGWHELGDEQLSQVFRLIASECSYEEIAITCLLAWSGLTVIGKQPSGNYLMQLGKEFFEADANTFAELISQIDWLTKIPQTPVRLSKINGKAPLPADFQGISFETFIICDNLYQGFLQTKSDKILDELAEVLYGGKVKLHDYERISIFYWWAALKDFFSLRFSDFFKPLQSENNNLLGDAPNIANQLQEAMDAQIRALTKGDITKEQEILALDTWRALTELNAQAREYKQLQNQIKR